MLTSRKKAVDSDISCLATTDVTVTSPTSRPAPLVDSERRDAANRKEVFSQWM